MRSLTLTSLSFLILVVAFSVPQKLHAQTIPRPGESFSAITTNGMWTWYADPKAVYYEGIHKKTYMGWVTNTGVVQIASYDHETGDTAHFTAPNSYGADDHNHPALFIRPDGRIVAYYTGHDGGTITGIISTAPEDITSFQTQFSAVGAGGFCYPNTQFLSAEGTSGRLYLFFRDTGLEPCFATSDDWGRTFTPIKHMYTNVPAGYKPYVKYCSNGKNEIHMVIERENRNTGPQPLYFVKYKAGVFYTINNVQIATMAQLPFADTLLISKKALLMQPGNFGCSGTAWDIALDASGNPVVVYDLFKDTNNHSYWYFRWTGTSWFKRPLVNSGAFMGAEGGFSGGVTLDHENPNVVYMSRQILSLKTTFNLLDTSYNNYKTAFASSAYTVVDATHEIDKWTTKDNGSTWDSVAITRNSAGKNCRPCVPRGHKEGMNVSLIWLDGTYTGMGGANFLMAVRMYPTNIPVAARQIRSGRPHGMNMLVTGNGISFTLAQPQYSSLRIYGLNGSLIADLTRLLRNREAGPVFVPFWQAQCASGTYLFVFNNGITRAMQRVIVSR